MYIMSRKLFSLRRRSCRLLMKSKSRWYGCSYREELAFPFAERSLTMADRKMTPEEEQTEKREVTRQVYRFLSEECDRELAWGNAHGSQTYEACDAEAGRRNGSGTDQEVP